ncbi:MAG: translation initiation factor IF-2 subunit alpha, partial [Candidatus Aenigmarchaeota archaeon]|nr:translation initiation factor IF-2 subunit alpha [Candidatus Aenigmarchaeota archaeon]
ERRAEKILEQAANELGKSLDQAYEEVGFLLQEKFGDLSVAFEEARKSRENLIKKGVPEQWADAISKIAEKAFKEKEVTIKAELELKSYAEDGINRIKETLSELQEKTGAEIKYISAPRYRVELIGKDPKSTEKKLIESLEAAVKKIKQLEGEGSYKLIK